MSFGRHTALTQLRARRRLLRRKLHLLKRRVIPRALLFCLRVQNQGNSWARRLLSYSGKMIASIAALLLAVLFAYTLPVTVLSTGSLKISEVHLACAGIIGTALALVLTLSIVPAQKAADVFSTAILKLYARDRQITLVFSLLSCAVLLSILLGTAWNFAFSPRYTLAVQLMLLGISLDALRGFYIRTLNLLDPATALRLVKEECERYITRTKRTTERVLRIQKMATPDAKDAVVRYSLHAQSALRNALSIWVGHLEEFAHKAVSRRDTQAASTVIDTLRVIGESYSEFRRDSIILLPDFSGGIPLGVSDISNVLNPISESIKVVCEDAAKESNELIVRSCLRALSDMAGHAMTMVHDAEGYRTAPLAFAAVYYLEAATKSAVPAGMQDALLAAVEGTKKVFAQISKDVRTREAESEALDLLFSIAVAGYGRQSMVPAYRAVETMLLAAQHEIRVRGYEEVGSIFSTALEHIAFLVPLEAKMDKAGQRIMQTFPPYSLGFNANIPTILAEIAGQVKPVEPDRAWVDPFDDFEEASKTAVHHYREIAKVDFSGCLLEKWIIDSIITAAKIHIQLLDNPPGGGKSFLDTVDGQLRWYIYTPAFFFNNKETFPYHHAKDACDELAVLGMELLQRGYLESAEACGKSIASIARKSAEADNTRSYTRAYGYADCILHLEQLACAAAALGLAASAAAFRGEAARPETITDEKWPEYAEALQTRTRQMERELREARYARGYGPRDAVALLGEIVARQQRMQAGPGGGTL